MPDRDAAVPDWGEVRARCTTHHACDCIAAERDALRAALDAVVALCDASDEADLRPADPNFAPIEIPWTVAVRAAASVPLAPETRS